MLVDEITSRPSVARCGHERRSYQRNDLHKAPPIIIVIIIIIIMIVVVIVVIISIITLNLDISNHDYDIIYSRLDAAFCAASRGLAVPILLVLLL